ncbi:GNAT family N-acetyltransferase [Aquimarina sp. 2-A2]|uniref:GNAT family N-acetyltransferase n=1 Tax=Aquimarina sp. 2-A2 TaxID=3382644 RepID=UPI00387EFD3A
MVTLKGESVYLRALEPTDLDFLYTIENDEEIWELSSTQAPYSKFLIKQYLENSHQDIYEAKQLRLVICKNDAEVLGLIDLYDFNPKHGRVGVGIVVANANNRGKGYGSEALRLVIQYSFAYLHVHQLYANVSGNNTRSRTLFEANGFLKVGVKKDWNRYKDGFQDEILYQLIKVCT